MRSLICVLTLAFALAGCKQSNNGATAGKLEDQRNTMSTLKAPDQPQLKLSASPETLTFTWQRPTDKQLASIYAYDTTSSIETLIAGDMKSSNNSLSIASDSATRPWHAQQFRLQLCDADQCVSSQRMNISTLAASSMNMVRPAVFLQGEQFGDSIAVNEAANLFITTRPLEGAIQIYLHTENRWVATTPIQIESSAASLIRDVASSASGDTLAVLVSENTQGGTEANVRIVERLGEAWIAVEQIKLPPEVATDNDSTVSMSADAMHIWVHTRKTLLHYQQTANQWHLDKTFSQTKEHSVEAFTTSRDSTVIHQIEKIDQQLWLISHRNNDSSGYSPDWQEFHRSVIQGVNAGDEVFLTCNVDGTKIAIAGWEHTQLTQRTPVVWRFAVHTAPSDDMASKSVQDSLRVAPSDDARARLRFTTSDTLEHLALGWQSQAGDDARITTFSFNTNEQRWRLGLELPADVSTLAKQGFAHDMALSADGQTLVISTPSGNASDIDNRAGELLIIR